MANPINAPVYITIDGNQYRLNPLKLKDLQELVNFLQHQYVQGIKQDVNDLPQDIQISLLKDAIHESKKIQIGSTDFSREIASISGIAKCFELSVRNNHKDMDYGTCLDLLTPENMIELGSALAKLTGLNSDDDNSDFQNPVLPV